MKIGSQWRVPFGSYSDSNVNDFYNFYIWVSFRENEPSLYIYGSVSEKMSLRYIYIKVSLTHTDWAWTKHWTHTHTHTHKHTHTHTHTDWACTTCSDIGSYFSHCFHKVYLYMPVHTHMDTHTHTQTHTHTHTHTQTGLVPLAVILVHISHTVFTKYTCTCLCTHT